MENESLASASVTVSPTFWDNFKAAILLIPHQGKPVWVLHAIFPVVGLLLLILPPLFGQRLDIGTLLVAVFGGFGFTPLVLASAIFAARRNKLAEPPMTYCFTDEGVHIEGKAFSQDLKWSAIPKCRLTRTFFYVFIGRATAFYIPVADLRRTGVLDAFCAIARAHTDFK